MLILGVHVSLSSKILDNKKTAKKMSIAIERDCDEMGLNAAQIFVAGPRNSIVNKLDYEDIIDITTEIDLSVHSSYPTVSIWDVTHDNAKSEKSIHAIEGLHNQLLAAKKIKAHGIVIHIGHLPKEQIAETMSCIKHLAVSVGVMILLEMVSSKSSDMTYETGPKLDALIELLGVDETYYGITVDTAHLWGAGVQIQTNEEMSKWLSGMRHSKKIKQWHLNGSSATSGSGKDKHEICFSSDDVIYHNIEPKKSGVNVIVKHAVENSIPIICEINRGLEEDCLIALNEIKKLGIHHTNN